VIGAFTKRTQTKKIKNKILIEPDRRKGGKKIINFPNLIITFLNITIFRYFFLSAKPSKTVWSEPAISQTYHLVASIIVHF